MRIGIYSPYLDTAGGGEKYILKIAEILSLQSEVDILMDKHLSAIGKDYIINRITALHGLDLSKVNFIQAPIGRGSNLLARIFFLRKYDWVFYLTDGSIFFSTAKRSVIHFQVPFEQAPTGVWGKIKLKTWDIGLYNSIFTKEHIEKNWGIPGEVVYPPVDVNKFKLLKKEKQILSVGRFFGFLKDKKHRFLIESFQKFSNDKSCDGWSLHLAGGLGQGDQQYLEELKDLAKGYKIQFYPNASLAEVIKLYGQSSIYWHASGYGETDPKKFEHFGITVVEAMSSGCIPVVVNKGGLKEIVTMNKTGYLWDTQEELLGFTKQLLTDKNLMEKIQKEGMKESQKFNQEVFAQKIKGLVYG